MIGEVGVGGNSGVMVGGGGSGSICSVCAEPIKKHRCMHYGAITCYSCRAFFRRACQEKKNRGNRIAAARYKCKGEARRCDVTGVSASRCKYCRFQQCLKVGMKPELVLNQKEKEERFKQFYEKKQKKKHSSGGSAHEDAVGSMFDDQPIAILEGGGLEMGGQSSSDDDSIGDKSMETDDDQKRIEKIKKDLEMCEEMYNRSSCEEPHSGSHAPSAFMEVACQAICTELVSSQPAGGRSSLHGTIALTMLGKDEESENLPQYEEISLSDSADFTAHNLFLFNTACSSVSAANSSEIKSLSILHAHGEPGSPSGRASPQIVYFQHAIKLINAQYRNYVELLPQFQRLPESDRVVLQERNSKLFLMYVFGRYFTAATGHEQLQWLAGDYPFNATSPAPSVARYIAYQVPDSDSPERDFQQPSQATTHLLNLSRQLRQASAVTPKEKHLIALLLAFRADEHTDLVESDLAACHQKEVESLLHLNHFPTLCKMAQRSILQITSSMVGVFDASFS